VVQRLTILLSLLPATAVAQPIGTIGRQVAANQAFTPVEQYLRGTRVSGAFPLPSDLCALAPAKRIAGEGWITDLRRQVHVPLPNGLGVQVGAEGMLRAHVLGHIQGALGLLLRNRDPLAMGHFVCVGLYGFARPNAISYGHGYIAYAPTLLGQHGHPEALEFVALHELAHQIQAWGFIRDAQARAGGQVRLEAPHTLFSSTARGKELEADCVAGAFFRLARYYVPPQAWAIQYANVLGAALKLGDTNFQHHDHHGTGSERAAAARAGVQVAEALLAFRADAGVVTSDALLSRCGDRVTALGIR